MSGKESISDAFLYDPVQGRPLSTKGGPTSPLCYTSSRMEKKGGSTTLEPTVTDEQTRAADSAERRLCKARLPLSHTLELVDRQAWSVNPTSASARRKRFAE